MEMQMGGQYISAPLFCNKMITGAWTLEFKVSKPLYWSVLFDTGIQKITINVFILSTEIWYPKKSLLVNGFWIKTCLNDCLNTKFLTLLCQETLQTKCCLGTENIVQNYYQWMNFRVPGVLATVLKYTLHWTSLVNLYLK